MTPGAKAALALWLSAIVWDVVCPPGQTISEAVERGLADKRTEPIVTALIVITAAHLLRAVDARFDLYSLTFKAVGRAVKRNHGS